MSPVSAPRHISFAKISMCSDEKEGWPGYRDLSNQATGYRDEKNSNTHAFLSKESLVSIIQAFSKISFDFKNDFLMFNK